MEAPDTNLAARLVETGVLTPAQLNTALDVHQALVALGEPRRLPDLLVALGFVPAALVPAEHVPSLQSAAHDESRCDHALAARLARCLRHLVRLAP